MKPRRPLQVKKVSRYRGAKYPSHQDPDPTRNPAPVPFPFARGIAVTAAALGVSAGLGAQDDPRGERKLENPFTVERSGLPHRTSSFGTGAPSRIEEARARELIERIFSDAGFALKRDQPWTRGDISFVADGYDSEKKVGYVWGTYQRLDRDAIISWNDPKEGADAADPKMLSLKEARQLEESAARDKEFIALITPFDKRFEYAEWSEDSQAEMQAAAQIADPAKRAVAVRAIQEKAARVALENLERCVREYIDWARSQGAP